MEKKSGHSLFKIPYKPINNIIIKNTRYRVPVKNKLIDEINKANSLNQDYTMKTYVGRTRSECLALIQNNTYDIIILDICIKTENSRIYQCRRFYSICS